MRKKLATCGIAAILLMRTTLNAADLLENANDESLAAVIAQIAAENGVNEKDEQGNTPLHRAAKNGDLTQVNMLIRAGASLEETDNLGNTSLALAVRNKQLSVARVLLTAGADPNVIIYTAAGNNDYVFSYACETIPTTNMARALLDAGANVNAVENFVKRSCMHLISVGLIRDSIDINDFGQKALDYGADVNLQAKDPYKDISFTALYESAGARHIIEMAQKILNAGAYINEVDEEGNTVLHKVILLPRVRLPNDKKSDFVLLLLSEGADANIKNNIGHKPIDLNSQECLNKEALSALRRATIDD